MKLLVTGAAGFIGFHLCNRLCKDQTQVIGIDNLNDYYDVKLKEARLQQLKNLPNFNFIKIDLADQDSMVQLFNNHQFDIVVNLAAQVGVRYSLKNPHAYVSSNLVGFINILEGCRKQQVQHLVFASSSSVYGANTKYPFCENDNIDHPLALYAATKKSNELMAHTYANLYKLPCTGLRFFTVYGPWGRPDMALFKFTKNILDGKPINVYNNGNMQRDFTYIDDVIESVTRILNNTAKPDTNWQSHKPNPGTSFAPYSIYNVGNNQPVNLLDFIEALEKELGKEAIKNMMPMQPGDVLNTYANTTKLIDTINFKPSTSTEAGIRKFIEWYKTYYKLDIAMV